MTEIPLDLAKKYFEDIKTGFEVNKSLQYSLGVDSLNASLQYINHPDALSFIDRYLYQIINILLEQNPHKIGVLEKSRIEESLNTAVEIVVKLLPSKPALLSVIAKIFDQSMPFYYGIKTYYNVYSGFPIIRGQMALKFSGLHGFDLILQSLQGPNFQWLGTNVFLNIIRGLNFDEVLHQVSSQVRIGIVETIAKHYINLPDEILKKENSDTSLSFFKVMGYLISWQSKQIKNYKKLDELHQLWLSFVLRLINSNSLILKLFGWDILQNLVDYAIESRAFAKGYIVEGAGTEIVNGVYNFSKYDNKGIPQYEKVPTETSKYLLTLMRFNMSDKSSRWFITFLRTNNDLDFYEDFNCSSDRRQPTSNQWISKSSSQAIASLVGQDPAPTLKRIGYILSDNATDDMVFYHRFSSWAINSDILSSVFNNSMHREIVSRSERLLTFLADQDLVDINIINLIWKAGLTSSSEDIVEEIFNLLVIISLKFNNELFKLFINMILNYLREDINNNISKVSNFIDKYTREMTRYITLLQSNESSIYFILLVWEIYKYSGFEQLKSSSHILELLSKCLQLPVGKNFIVQRLIESINELNHIRLHNLNESENKFNQIVNQFLFLLNKQSDDSIVNELNKFNFIDVILNEIARYINKNRLQNFLVNSPTNSSPVSPTNYLFTYTTGISIRLQLLRKFYGLSSNKITIEQIDKLWSLLSFNSYEVNELLLFFMNGGQQQDDIQPFGDVDVLLYIFNNYICNDMIDWTKCSENVFTCFVVYFSIAKDRTPSYFTMEYILNMHTLGLNTLWRILLNTPYSSTSKYALELLLNLFDDMSTNDSDAYNSMINTCFGYIVMSYNNFDNKSNDTKSIDLNLRYLERCIEVLYQAVLRSKGDNDTSHAISGLRSRYTIRVFHHRVNVYPNITTKHDVMSTIKGSEGVIDLEVHPLQTIYHIKRKLTEELNFPDITMLNILFNKANLFNTNRLIHCNIVEGSELNAIYKQPLNKYQIQQNNFLNNGNINDNWPSSPFNQILSNDAKNFKMLISLCNNHVVSSALVKKIWEIISIIPTQRKVLDNIISSYISDDVMNLSNNDLDSSIDSNNPCVGIEWDNLLQNTSALSELAYILEVTDNLLQPADDCDIILNNEQSIYFLESFIENKGFDYILKILLTIDINNNHIINRNVMATALHITNYLLFNNGNITLDTSIQSLESDIQSNMRLPNSRFLDQLLQSSTILVEKLLKVAGDAASSQESLVVQDALAIITSLLQSKEAAKTLTSNPQAELLLSTVLRGGSKKVRELAADFAIQFGRSQPIVFKWLLSILDSLLPNDEICSDIIRSCLILLHELHIATSTSSNLLDLSNLLSRKLLFYKYYKPKVADEPKLVLRGLLELLAELVKINYNIIQQTELGKDFLYIILKDFLFLIPKYNNMNDSIVYDPICNDSVTRQTAFKVLTNYLNVVPNDIVKVIEFISDLIIRGSQPMRSNWEVMLSYDIKKSDINYLGLKNQGCTCYSNSFLQQLFMNVNFRESVLLTPLLQQHRTTVSNLTNEDLVGKKVLFEWRNHTWNEANILSYDPSTNKHDIEYVNIVNRSLGSVERKIERFNAREFKRDIETGRVRVITPDMELELKSITINNVTLPTTVIKNLSDSDTAAYNVFEQLQRLFIYLKLSKKRYYDPKPLVDACKTLNMNFDVYHQNDAAEFCDQLLDRIEIATKGKHTQINSWNDFIKSNIFGGNFLTQKLPQDCDLYQVNKLSCGHYLSSKYENFLKIECIIRNKEFLHDSLKELVQGELMDGENKIACEVCTQKKAAIRRTCIDNLPNTLVIHLKRFDLDFTTFETVKLNSRLEFPLKLNVYKYTKIGMEYEEKKLNQISNENVSNNISDDMDEGVPDSNYNNISNNIQAIEVENEIVEPDSIDFEYDLQGVLVHSGVAQGGHYYSFIKDNNQWYRFDDDEVSLFFPDQIPYQCYGGPLSSFNIPITNNLHADDERSSNALMLFYTKVKPSTINLSIDLSNVDIENNKLVNGYEAFSHEVHESNLLHNLSCYLLDHHLHSFVCDLLILTTVSNADTVMQDNVSFQIFKFSIEFLFDIILHCRERSNMKQWIHTFNSHFELYSTSSVWLLRKIAYTSTCNWFVEYLLLCNDFLSRTIFIQLVTNCLSNVSSMCSPFERLKSLSELSIKNLLKLISENNFNSSISLIDCVVVLFISNLILIIHQIPIYIRNSDEIFVLIRDMANIPIFNKLLNCNNIIPMLCYFIIPEVLPEEFKKSYHLPAQKSRNIINNNNFNNNLVNNLKFEYQMMYSSIYEAIASLIGIPQIRKVNLLQDNKSYNDKQLIPEAISALTIIFNEVSMNGFIDGNSIFIYLEHINGFRPNQSIVKQMLDFTTCNDRNKLNLEGYIRYYTETASFSPKDLWNVFYHYGFRNDLTRNNMIIDGESIDLNDNSRLPIQELCLSKLCIDCLSNIGFYEAGMESNEEVTKNIVRKVCHGNDVISFKIIAQITKKLYLEAQNHVWGPKIDAILDFLSIILKIEDEFTFLRYKETMVNVEGGLILIVKQERNRPTQCRTNDYDNKTLLNRYIDFIQYFCKTEVGGKLLRKICEEVPIAIELRGMLKLRPDSNFTEDEENHLRNISILVQDAGHNEVNGTYKFINILNDAGYFGREGLFQNRKVFFTLYRCSTNTGSFQWFISITPPDRSPGTDKDIDFYNSQGYRGVNDRLPPKQQWNILNNGQLTQFIHNRAPTISYIIPNNIANINSNNIESSISSMQIRPTIDDDDYNFNVSSNSINYNNVNVRRNIQTAITTNSPLGIIENDEDESMSDQDSTSARVDDDLDDSFESTNPNNLSINSNNIIDNMNSSDDESIHHSG